MKNTFVVSLALILPVSLFSQSSMEFQSGTTIEVTSGAEICADNIAINGTYSGEGTQCGGALPVQMAALSIDVAGRSVTIAWSTVTEVNNYGFEIERRPADRVHEVPDAWTSIAFLRGSGTSTSPKGYSFTDEGIPPGRYAYRIRQIDNNGSFVFSDVTEVEVGMAPRAFSLSQNYPNPFNPTTTIEFTLAEDGAVVLRLFDLSGKELMTLLKEERKAGYYQQVTVKASQLSSGTYIYALEAVSTADPAKKYVERKKMILLR